MLERVIAVVEEEFPDPTVLAGRWRGIRDDARRRWADAATAAERECVAGRLLDGLGTSHCLLLTAEVRAKIDAATADPRRLAPIVRPMGATVVVALRSFKAGTTTRDDLAAIAAALATADRAVLDLRLNDGGSGGLVAEAAGIFLPPGTPVLRVRDRAGRSIEEPFVVTSFPEDCSADHDLEVRTLRERHHVLYRTPADPVGTFDGQVVIVTDSRCYSCGEVFVQALREHGRARVAGRRTAGMVVAAMTHDLGGGDSLLLPFAEMTSGLGARLEGRGVAPHVEMDVADLDSDALLAALTERGLLPAEGA